MDSYKMVAEYQLSRTHKRTSY